MIKINKINNFFNQNLKIIFSGLIIIFAMSSCVERRKIQLFSPDMEQSITVFCEGNYRYIANGQQKKVPDSNYVKIDVSNVPHLGDYICVCWQTEYKWEVIVDKSIIIENKLDTAEFQFNTDLPRDERGFPSVKKFREDNCALFDFYSMKLIPDKGAIVKY